MVSTSPLQKGRSCSLAVWKLYLATHSVPLDHGAYITQHKEEGALITVWWLISFNYESNISHNAMHTGVTM